MTDPDWPAVLVRNAAVCELARALFKARGQLCGGSQCLTQQPPSVRDRFITLADDILIALERRPVLVAGDFQRLRLAWHASRDWRDPQ